MPAGCFACDLAEGRVPLPGGGLLDAGRWLVEHCAGPLGVGTLVVKPRRHVLHVADLDERESAELGPLLRRAADVAGRDAAAVGRRPPPSGILRGRDLHRCAGPGLAPGRT